MPGALTDILTSDQQHIYLRDLVYDWQTATRNRPETHTC